MQGLYSPISVTTPAEQEAAARQAQLAQALQAQAAGNGPSMAQSQLRQGTEANLASQLAGATAERGNQNPGAIMQQLGSNAASTGQQAAGQSADIKTQEQQAATGQLGSVLGQTQQGQGQLGVAQGGLTGALNQANAANQTQQSEFGNTLNAGQYSNYNNAIAGQNLQQEQEAYQSQQNLMNDIFGVVGGGIGAIPKLLTSDENAKTDIKDEHQSMRDFLDALDSHSYKYKDPDALGAAQGTHFGPMAQELEESKVGAASVQTGSDGGKMVNTGRLTMSLASALGELHQRLSKLEGGNA